MGKPLIFLCRGIDIFLNENMRPDQKLGFFVLYVSISVAEWLGNGLQNHVQGFESFHLC